MELKQTRMILQTNLEHAQEQLKESEARERRAHEARSEAADELPKLMAKFKSEREAIRAELTKLHDGEIEKYKTHLENASTQLKEMDSRLAKQAEEFGIQLNDAEEEQKETSQALQAVRAELKEKKSLCKRLQEEVVQLKDDVTCHRDKFQNLQEEKAEESQTSLALIDRLQRQVQETKELLEKERSANAATLTRLENTLIAMVFSKKRFESTPFSLFMNDQLSLKSVIGFTGSVNGGLHYTRCGRFIAFPLGSVVVLRSLVSKKQFFLDAGVGKKISCVAISKDGFFLATGHETPASFKAEITVWDLKKAIDHISNDNDALPEGCLLHVLSQHHKRVEAVDFSCDSQFLTSLGGQDDNDIVVWNVKSGAAICGAQASTEFAHCVRWLNNRNDRFVTCGVNHARVWQVDVAMPKLHPIDITMGSIRRVIQCLCISEDDSFAYTGNKTGEVIKFNIERDDIKPFNEPEVHHPSLVGYNRDRFSKGIKSVACIVNPTTGNTNVIAGAGDGTIQILNPDLKRIPSHEGKLHGAITSIALHPDGQSFLVGTESSQRYSIDVSTFTPELRETCHAGEIFDLRFPRKSSEIFVTASEQDIRVWSVSKRRELLRINVPNLNCYAVDITSAGDSICLHGQTAR
ncbi:WD40 repeat domain-containing protein [Skeletonema marinoi]|uniref:Cilia- and flagella-associated protein 52 n=1 Tax=Skeletonema marinoi TaxID=267567 RepID=A0AAD8Y6P4_9STRA|nr:WD40 repeat domain-containing protein [Skeletonema marinoi]